MKCGPRNRKIFELAFKSVFWKGVKDKEAQGRVLKPLGIMHISHQAVLVGCVSIIHGEEGAFSPVPRFIIRAYFSAAVVLLTRFKNSMNY